MRTKNELYQEAMRTVAARRQMARARAEDARAEAEAAIPALRHAEEEVRVRGIRCALAGAAGKDRTEAAAALADAKQKLTALLAQSGRPADALEPRFVCPKCQDTGSVNGRTCECVHKVMQQLRRKEIEALSSLSIASLTPWSCAITRTVPMKRWAAPSALTWPICWQTCAATRKSLTTTARA